MHALYKGLVTAYLLPSLIVLGCLMRECSGDEMSLLLPLVVYGLAVGVCVAGCEQPESGTDETPKDGAIHD